LIRSPTHHFKEHRSANEDKHTAQLEVKESHRNLQDFILLFANAETHKPQVLIGRADFDQ
jgi:hypothetical protein